ncbi:GNAT family N-acetyltransferase [Roseococcus sp. YIM B11640]|uniref:GNAT family N-acetyltransferase n=1 Tax=Roseococcus sp. YIM B11640 TaxID=3133973 RepID=UPI003C7A0CE3
MSQVFTFGPPPFPELRAGNLGVRVATEEWEVLAAQALRYRVFYEEMGAHPDAATALSKLDADGYDAVADHLLVVDHDRGAGPESVVGTYRLIRRSAAQRIGQFYSQDEYDISTLLNYPGGILELGRSCTAIDYRTRGTLQLLWQGIAAYVFNHKIAVMFGCASLQGLDLDANAEQLSYLAQHHMAPEHLRPRALESRYLDMDRLPRGSYDAKAALMALPPLIKGYLRLGGYVGDGAVLDPQFNTTDVAIVVMTDQVTDKYYKHYERKAGWEGHPERG